jgi:hypothetical protein
MFIYYPSTFMYVWGELDQSTLYACMEVPQWNTFVQLICVNKNQNKNYHNKTLNNEWDLKRL